MGGAFGWLQFHVITCDDVVSPLSVNSETARMWLNLYTAVSGQDEETLSLSSCDDIERQGSELRNPQ